MERGARVILKDDWRENFSLIEGKKRKKAEGDVAPELSEWFSVPGDIDDFIYYHSLEKTHSEK